MRVYLQTKSRVVTSWYYKATLLIFLLFSLHFNASSQCAGSNQCQVCGVTAVVGNVQGATINNGASNVNGSVNAGGLGVGNPLELTATGCGVISMDVTITFDWDQGANVNWIHGVAFTSSPGWTAAQGNNPGAGWIFQNNIVGCCSGAPYDAGFYFDGTTSTSNCCGGATPGNPADNYGINCTTGCGAFTFSLEYCPSNVGTILEAVTFTLTDDGETGDWIQPAGCVFDLTFPVQFNDAGIQLPTDPIGPVCEGDPVQLNAGGGCDSYQWDNGDTGPVITVFPTATTTYCVTATTVSGCMTMACIDVITEPCCDAMAGSPAAPSVCAGDPIAVSVSGNNTDVIYAQYLVLTDLAGNIIETISGSAGNFSPQPPGDYLVYSYNTDGVLSCGLPFPPFNTNMNTIDANCGVPPACGMVSSTPINIQACCTPLAGSITPNPAALCPGGTFTATASGFDANNDQAIIFADDTGTITDVLPGSSGTFMLGMNCATYQVCSYNYCSGTLPSPGSNTASLACGGAGTDCDIFCATVSAQDNEPPQFVTPPQAVIMVDCAADIPPAQPLDWTDNCDGTGTIIPIESGSADCNGGNITRQYEYTDACGNFLGANQVVQVAPVPPAMFDNMPPDETLVCGAPLPGPPQPLTYSNGLSGACAEIGSIQGVQQDNTNGCQGGTITNTWNGVDACGNPLVYTQTYTIPATTPASFVNPPPNETLTCGAVVPPPGPLMFDNGDPSCPNTGTVMGVQQDNTSGCQGGTVINMWNGVDACGNALSYTQTLTIPPTPQASFVNIPPDTNLQCGEVPPPAGLLNFENNDPNCPNSGAIMGVQQDNTNGCQGGTITNTWSGVDNCNNPLMYVQTYTIPATTPANFINPPGDQTLTCDGIAPQPQPLMFDNGDPSCPNTGTVNGVQQDNTNGCQGGTITNTWSGVDACNNPLMHVQTFTIPPTPPANFINPPADQVLACGDVIAPPQPLMFDNGDPSCPNTGMINGIQQDNTNGCQGGTITNTWNDVDACGNPLVYTQTLTIPPAPPAMFINPPPNTAINCGDPLPPLNDLNFDNGEIGSCANSGTLPGVMNDMSDACGGVITYTWAGADACGNPLNYVQTITVNPGPPAMFVNPPADIAINCGDPLPPPAPLTFDNGLTGSCQNTGVVNGVANDMSNPCTGGIITYEWVGVDNCGNPLNYIQTINVSPAPAPTLQNPPADIVINCGDPLPPLDPLTFDNGLTGSCQIVGQIPGSMQDNSDPCVGGQIIYTWSGADQCGNPLDHTQMITVNPAPAPMLINPPNDINLLCGEPLPPLIDLQYDNQLTGNCQIFGQIPGTIDDQSDPCTGGQIIYTWSGVDQCGNPLDHTQVITLSPPPPAMLTSMPPDLVLECGDPIPPLMDLQYNNNEVGLCQIIGTVPGNQSGNVDPCFGGVIIYTWSAVDQCGNPYDHTQTITVNPPPTAMFVNPPADLNLQCGDFIPPLMDLQYDNGAVGQCQSTGFIQGVESGGVDPCVGGTLIYEWNGVDACGTPLVHVQTITVSAATPPTFVNLPPDLTLQCGEPLPPPADLIYDNGLVGLCQITGSIPGVEVGVIDPCFGGVIQYVWDGFDACGNQLTHTQNITFDPAPPASFLNLPPDLVLNCNDPVPPLTDLQYDNFINGPCQNTGFIQGVEIMNFDPCTGGSIIYEWNGVDNCGQPLQHTQTITISPADMPMIVGFLPQDITIECGDPLPPLMDLQYDNAAFGICQLSGFIPGQQFGNPDPCLGGLVTYEWNAVDACGNPLIWTQNITVNPPPPPQFLFVPPNVTVDCNTIPPMQPLQYDNGSFGSCNISGVVSGIEIDDMGLCPRTLTRIWEFNDPCTGAFVQETQEVFIIDLIDPVLLGAIPPDITLCEGEFPEPFDIPWQDNCGEFGIAEPQIFDNGDNFTIQWTATDACGNNTGGTQVISVATTTEVDIIGPSTVCEGTGIPVELCVEDGPYIGFAWNSGQNTQCIEAFIGGEYIVEVTDVNFCTAFGTFNLQGDQPPVGEISGNLSICEGETTDLTASGGTNFIWSEGSQTSATINVSTGNYCVTIYDTPEALAIGCFDEVCVTVGSTGALDIVITGDDEICEGETSTLTATGAGNYIWTTAEGTQTGSVITVSTSQTVTVSGDNGTGCTATEEFIVNVLPNPTPTISGNLTICSGESTMLSLTETYDSVEWSTGETSATITVSTGQTIGVTVTNGDCTGSTQVNVNENQNPAPTIAGSNTFCTGESTTLDAGLDVGGVPYTSYAWSPNGQMSQTITVNVAGTYTVIVTDANGCSAEASIVVTESDSLEPNLSGSDFCEGEMTMLDAGTGFTTYQWSANAGSATTQTVMVDASGTYSVTVSNGTCSGDGSITVDEVPNPVVDLGDDRAICGGTEVVLDAGAGFAYEWSDGSISQTLSVTASGTYGVTITTTDGTNCTGTDEVTVTFGEATPPTITGDDEICTGETTTLDAGVGYASYLWTPGDIMSQTIDVTVGGAYTCVVTDTDGCTASSTFIVNENSVVPPTINGILAICEGEMTTLTSSNTYDAYLWVETGETTQSIDVTTAGTYTLVVTSAGNCSASTSVEVVVNSMPMPMITGDLTYCDGDMTMLSASAGFDNYSWSNLANGQNIDVSNPGEICVTVTDNAGCQGSTCVMVEEIASPQPTITGDDAFCEGDNSVLDAGVFTTYTWSTNAGDATTQTVTVDATGTYEVTVTNDEGCEASTQINVTENTPNQVQIGGSTTFCTGTFTTLSAISTVPNGLFASVTWSTGSTETTITVDMPGTISVTAIDVNGCTTTASVEVEESESLSPNVTGPMIFCQGESVELDAGEGFTGYIWSSNAGGAMTQVVTVDASGTYSVTVSDDGCTGVGSITITEQAELLPVISGLDFCEGDNTTLELSGQTYDSYLWSDAGASISSTLIVNESGTYSVTVGDAASCTGTASITVTANPLPEPDLGDDRQICLDQTTTLDPGTFFSYEWLDAESNTSNNPTLIASTTGTYNVTVTDNNGCSDADDIEVNVLAELEPTITGTPDFCQGDSTTIMVGEEYIAYQWSTNETTREITVTLPGNYSVVVTDESGCTGSANIAVTQNPNPTPSIAGSGTFCTGTSAPLSVCSNAEYVGFEWSTGETTCDISVDTEGTYCVTVTDINGCTGESCLMITESTSLEPNISGDDFCEGGSTVLDAGSGFTSYQWSANAGGGTEQTAIVDATGTYSVTVTDLSGCSGEGSIDITENPNPDIDLGPDQTICQGDSVVLDLGAGYDSYLWLPSGSVDQTITVAATGTVTGIVSQLGCADTATIMITVTPLPNPNITGSLTFCTSTTLDAGAGYATYAWMPNGETTQTIDVSDSGTYSVVVTDANGCTGTDEFTTTLDSELQPVIQGDTLFCFDESTELSAGTGFATYTWSANANGATTSMITATESGTYSVTVEDASGCSGSAEITVTENPEIIPEITGVAEFCFGEMTTLTASTGFETYAWSTGETTEMIDITSTGTWCVTVTDAAMCTASTCFETTESDAVVTSITGSTSFCIGSSTTLTATGEADGYTFEWMPNGETTAEISVNVAGMYSVTATNSLGCTSTASTMVEEDSELNPVVADVVFCSGDNATLDAGTGFTTYVWSTGEDTQTIDINTEDTYSVTVTDDSGCSGSTSALATEEMPLSAGVGTTTEQCEDETSSIDLSTLLTGADVNGTWSATDPSTGGFNSTDGTFDPTGLAPNTYEFTYTAAAGMVCPEDTESVSVTINEEPTVVIGMPSMLTCVQATSLLDGSGSTVGGTYLWETNGGSFEAGADLTQPTISATGVGTYTLTVTVNGCSASETVEVMSDGDVPTVTANTVDLINCTVTEVTLSVTTDIANPDYLWSGPGITMGDNNEEAMPVVSATGSYSVTVTNPANGCSASTSLTVDDDGNLPEVSIQALPTNVLDCTLESVLLQASVTNAGSDLTYQWYVDGEPILKGTNAEYDAFIAGLYTVEVTDNITGCMGEESFDLISAEDFPVLQTNEPEDLTCIVLEVELDGDIFTLNDGDVNIDWQDANGNTVGTTETIMVSEPGIYTLIAEDIETGCVNSTEVTVGETIDDPTANAGADENIGCNDTEAALDGSASTNALGANGGISFAWTDATGTNIGNASTVDVTSAGTYNLLITDNENGCTDESSVNVTISEEPEIDGVTPVDDGCGNTPSGSISVNGITGGTAPFMYSINGEPFTSNNTFNFLSGGTYSILVEDADGCTDSTEITLDTGQEVTVDLGTNIQVTPGQPNVLNATTNIPVDQIDQIIWTPAIGLDDPTSLTPTATISGTTEYMVTVIDINGCEGSASIVLQVELGADVYVPSAFSPNADGNNDFLTVFTSPEIQLVEVFRVYDRWGNNVYEDNNFEPNQFNYGWDGTFRGKELDPAVFVWYARVIMPSGRAEIFKGDVTIMR